MVIGQKGLAKVSLIHYFYENELITCTGIDPDNFGCFIFENKNGLEQKLKYEDFRPITPLDKDVLIFDRYDEYDREEEN